MKSLVNQSHLEAIPEILPVIPTMDVVVFPHMIVPLLVLDEKIIKGINESLEQSKLVMLLAAKENVDTQGAIGTDDLYAVGTVATIMRLIKIPEGGVKILVQGVHKARASNIKAKNGMLTAQVEAIHMDEHTNEDLIPHIRSIKSIAEKIVSSGHSFSPDFHIILSKMQDTDKISDFVLSHLNLSVTQAQELLETTSQKEFLEKLYHHLNKEVELSEIQEKIRSNAREAMNQAQKEYYLREQLRAIKRELGEDDNNDIDAMREKIETLHVNDEIKKEVIRQINRLERTAPDSLEATVTRNYLEWIFAMPWGIETSDNLDLNNARDILDEDHHGLKDIKDRILDYISVRILKKEGHSPILCFVGPPGTGKTSLGKSIAKSLGRKYGRISLGGVKDEAEIRGHRRTYVGAMPGRFIQAIRKAQSCNPLLVIDELDKIGSDFRGDPSAAMLEVLDPQQNTSFYDNYLGVPFDLSKILFVATANSLDTISGPLRDRMEIITLSGYTHEEKVQIGKKYLIKKAFEQTGIETHNPAINDDIVSNLIYSYTREAGVRQLERMITKLCSKAARALVETGLLPEFSLENLKKFIGPQRFLEDDASTLDSVGITNGLAWTPFGGEVLKIEVILMPGKGKLTLTGQLGEVMKESAQAAMSYARAHAKEFGIKDNLFTTNDVHIHVPAGAIPKDGPSAGITILIAILSALTNKPVNALYAMTGELNLRGEVMPIGGVKEKVLAAKRNKMKHIILPKRNMNDMIGIEDITKDIEVHWVDHADEVIEKVLLLKAKKKLPQVA